MVSIVLFMLVALAVASGVLYLTHAWERPDAPEADRGTELVDGGSR